MNERLAMIKKIIPYNLFILCFILSCNTFAEENSTLDINVSKVFNTEADPYKYICNQRILRKGIKSLWLWSYPMKSTGVFITPNIILTNAHNTHSNFFSYITKVTITPAKNGDIEPFGNHTILGRKNLKNLIKVPKEYGFSQKAKKRAKYDYALIYLPDANFYQNSDSGNIFTYGKCIDYAKEDDSISICGYPGKPKSGIEQYYGDGSLEKIKDKTILHNFWTATGNSGSPIWVNADGRKVVIGVHCFPKKATRIDQEVYDNITYWINEFEHLPH
jgi:glutamyl endopeptidase